MEYIPFCCTAQLLFSITAQKVGCWVDHYRLAEYRARFGQDRLRAEFWGKTLFGISTRDLPRLWWRAWRAWVLSLLKA